MPGCCINTAGHVEYDDMFIQSADRIISDSADRVTKKFQNTPAFSGISGAVDLFQSLQQEVLFQQIAVFSAQIQLIEEQMDYYRLKRQRLVENHVNRKILGSK